jgi:DNA-binding LytR/AlgR family response regulator
MHLTSGKSEEFYGTLKDIFRQQLQRFDFLYIHASFVVNYDHIAAVKYNELYLTNSVIALPISQLKRQEVRESYYSIMKRRRL